MSGPLVGIPFPPLSSRVPPAVSVPVSTALPGLTPWTIEPLQGWHLPLLQDPAFLALQPQLQRTLLMRLPDRLLSLLPRARRLAPQVLVARSSDASAQKPILGLIIIRRLNRSGSCWQVEHLRLALGSATTAEVAPAPGRRTVASALLREAIQRTPGAASWIATASSLDGDRLALLREQGFQPQRSERIWRWQVDGGGAAALPADLQLRPLQRRNAALLWHLEQAACPAPLRQLLDRRIEDLLDQSEGRGWLLIDPLRREAVAAVRWQGQHPSGGDLVELSIHPGWPQLLGSTSELLLRRFAGSGAVLWVPGDSGDQARHQWLERLGAVSEGERVLMARSVWRRQEWQPSRSTARHLEAVLEQFQPRRRPLPTPVGSAPGCAALPAGLRI